MHPPWTTSLEGPNWPVEGEELPPLICCWRMISETAFGGTDSISPTQTWLPNGTFLTAGYPSVCRTEDPRLGFIPESDTYPITNPWSCLFTQITRIPIFLPDKSSAESGLKLKIGTLRISQMDPTPNVFCNWAPGESPSCPCQRLC